MQLFKTGAMFRKHVWKVLLILQFYGWHKGCKNSHSSSNHAIFVIIKCSTSPLHLPLRPSCCRYGAGIFWASGIRHVITAILRSIFWQFLPPRLQCPSAHIQSQLYTAHCPTFISIKTGIVMSVEQHWFWKHFFLLIFPIRTLGKMLCKSIIIHKTSKLAMKWTTTLQTFFEEEKSIWRSKKFAYLTTLVKEKTQSQ